MTQTAAQPGDAAFEYRRTDAGLAAGTYGLTAGVAGTGLGPFAPLKIGSHARPPRHARTTSRRSAISMLVGADAAAVAVALVLAQTVDHLGHRELIPALASLVYIPVYIGVIGCYGLYHRPQRRLVSSSFPDVARIIHSLAVASLLALLGSGLVHDWVGGPSIDRTTAAIGGLTALFAVPVARTLVRLVVRPESVQSNVLVVGSGQVASMVVARLAKLDGFNIVGCVDDTIGVDDESWLGVPWLGRLSEVAGVIERWDVDHLIVAFSAANEAEIAAELRSVPDHVRISVVPRMFDLLTVRSSVDDLRGLPVVDVAPASLGLGDRMFKRAMDVAVSLLGIVLLAPVGLSVALVIKATSRGPVLFSQLRAGRNGKPFRIYKFRTMYESAERMKIDLTNDVDGPLFKAHMDPRVTPIGRLLRKLSLDELPQLLNVLVGEMSLVGPRPFVLSESAQIEGWAARRFDVRPGMTGLWQISGRNDLPFDELCRLDYLYVASWSLWWDLSILWRTPGRVFHQDGAY